MLISVTTVQVCDATKMPKEPKAGLIIVLPAQKKTVPKDSLYNK